MTSDLAFKKIVDEVMARQRRQDIELYKLFAKDDAFASSFVGALRRVTGS
jgi:type I restriction enzyme R subunit